MTGKAVIVSSLPGGFPLVSEQWQASAVEVAETMMCHHQFALHSQPVD